MRLERSVAVPESTLTECYRSCNNHVGNSVAVEITKPQLPPAWCGRKAGLRLEGCLASALEWISRTSRMLPLSARLSPAFPDRRDAVDRDVYSSLLPATMIRHRNSDPIENSRKVCANHARNGSLKKHVKFNSAAW